jgi:hypothetical protein
LLEKPLNVCLDLMDVCIMRIGEAYCKIYGPRSNDFSIRSVLSGDVITVDDGQVTLSRRGDHGCNEWVCVEDRNEWLGFRNVIAGRYLGYGKRLDSMLRRNLAFGLGEVSRPEETRRRLHFDHVTLVVRISTCGNQAGRQREEVGDD